MNKTARIVVLGGYGKLGERLSLLLAKTGDHITIAGPKLSHAKTLLNAIQQEIPNANVHAIALDWRKKDFVEKLKACRANILIHLAGPFVDQPFTVAKACIELGINYLDVANTRDFVCQIDELDEAAKKAQTVVISGVSTFPGLSSAVIDHFYPQFAILRDVSIGLTVPNQTHSGKASFSSLLADTGKPFTRLEQGRWKKVYGWQNIHRYYYGDNIGMRWHANANLSDLALFPERYPHLKTMVVHWGVEKPWMHWTLWHMSWLSRFKLIPSLAPCQGIARFVHRLFSRSTTQLGGMFIRLCGSDQRYQPREIDWCLVAQKGHGEYVAAIPCLILVDKLLKGELATGAYPCLGQFSLEEFDKVAASWAIYHTVSVTES